MKWLKGTNLFISESKMLEEITDSWFKHNQKVKAMKKNKQITHLDTGVKGCVIGLLTYIGVQQGWSAELIAGLVPVVAIGLSWVSTKIGDKNTTLLLKLVSEAVIKPGPQGPTGPKSKVA